jgi:hypothetical protein
MRAPSRSPRNCCETLIIRSPTSGSLGSGPFVAIGVEPFCQRQGIPKQAAAVANVHRPTATATPYRQASRQVRGPFDTPPRPRDAATHSSTNDNCVHRGTAAALAINHALRLTGHQAQATHREQRSPGHSRPCRAACRRPCTRNRRIACVSACNSAPTDTLSTDDTGAASPGCLTLSQRFGSSN